MSMESFLKEYNLDTKTYPITNIWYPIIGIIIYVATDLIFSPSESSKVTKKQTGPIFKTFVVLHNIGLALFSMMCFYNVFPIVWSNINPFDGIKKWENAMCNLFGDKLTGLNNTYGFWCWAFYVSKYYEFFDTWILLYKGRKPIFLQLFHHVGAVITCWLMVVNKSPDFWIFVTLNSFIHSVMYIYYAASTLKIKIPFKFIITIMQILQFLIGLTFSFSHFFLFYPQCYKVTNVTTNVLLQIYVGLLVYLFSKFFKKTYSKKPKKDEKRVNKKID